MNWRKLTEHCYKVRNMDGVRDAICDFFNVGKDGYKTKEEAFKTIQKCPEITWPHFIIINYNPEVEWTYIEAVDFDDEAHNPIYDGKQTYSKTN